MNPVDAKTKDLLKGQSKKDLMRIVFNIAAREAGHLKMIEDLQKRVEMEMQISGRMMLKNLELSGQVTQGAMDKYLQNKKDAA
ncbi:hypothetical protein [Parendozoicomonas haliclonae]|uniref:Uncharacterized protein n=1 Tax=Parendozoicomonas haliclonae TaxID=1960125 RepID=A0A1X7AE15_9GAMM|nr:hypothetical protein [Parendozoicomonas haliclonae]SMA33190.1 hypothetical protein EHSB41UT_00238 [Parendozoicomonas haliclonae]